MWELFEAAEHKGDYREKERTQIMFGIKIVGKNKYDALLTRINDLTNKCKTLEADKSLCQKSIEQLTEEINKQTPECKIGIWCEDCKYRKTILIDSCENYKANWISSSYISYKEPKYIVYCGKNILEVCPERESES